MADIRVWDRYLAWSERQRAQVIGANLLFILALFPFFKILPITAEVQPIGGLLGFAIWVMFRAWTRLGRALLPLFAVIGVYSFAVGIQVVLRSPAARLDATVEGVAILVAPLGLALGLEPVIQYVSARVVAVCAVVSALVGTLQLYAPALLRTIGASQLLSIAIPRLATASQGASGRGVSMLAPEPSYAAPSILLVLAACLWLYARGRVRRPQLALLLLLVGWMIVLNKSVTLVISVLIFFLMLGLGVTWRHKFIAVPAALVLGLGVWALQVFQASGIRGLRVAGEMSSLITSGRIAPSDFAKLSELNGSERLTSVLKGYAGAATNYGTGLGLGSWHGWLGSVSSSSYDINFLTAHPKPYAYGAFVGMALGIPGLVALAYALIRVVWESRREQHIGLVVATVAISLIGILANSPVSLPAYWAMLLFILPQGPSPAGLTRGLGSGALPERAGQP